MRKNHVAILAWAMLGVATLAAVGTVLSRGPAVTPAWASNTQQSADTGK